MVEIETRQKEIERLNKQIVLKMEAGEDYSGLSQQRDKIRAEIGSLLEDRELQKVADERKRMADKAAKIQERVERQGETIDRFLKLRDAMVEQLQPLLEPMKALAIMQSLNRDGPGECYKEFNDPSSLAATVNGIPAGYLPADFGCPFVELVPGTLDAHGKAGEAYGYFLSAYGILTNLQKVVHAVPLRPAEGLMAKGEESEEAETTHCLVCGHKKVKEINAALRTGRSLRDIEADFGVSRSTLDRHKNKCLPFIPVEKESPAASANQTYFHP